MKLLRNLSLTVKLSALIVVINAAGLAGLAINTWRQESAQMLAFSERGWIKDSEQFATLAAGGVKWGKSAVVQEAYALYRENAALNLTQFSALNASGAAVDAWTRPDIPMSWTADDIAAFAKQGGEKSAVSHASVSNGLVAVASPLPLDKKGKPQGVVVTVWSAEAIFAEARNKALTALAIQSGVIILAVAAFLFAMRRLVGAPLGVIGDRISRLQAGDFDTPVIHQDRGDEIGFLARALDLFRQQAIEKVRQTEAAEQQRLSIEAERRSNAESERRSADRQRSVVDTLAAALGTLAEGDFSIRLDDLGAEFSEVQRDFNRMIEAVAEAIDNIKRVSVAVESGSQELATSAEQLAKRTEQQAAALEETAAALSEVSSTVDVAARNAQTAVQMVEEAKSDAHNSALIVRDAIGAMDQIQTSSSQIGKIIGVIDEIAFQTNLLALNAGVEAARAGEAGKGFAVVAQEVRELAQRSANAAKEIKQLVTVSSAEVSNGVNLVNRTGDALVTIEERVNGITRSIQAMVESYQSQANGLREINGAMNQMDQTTQQNAAMVEETSAACHDLLSQSQALQAGAQRFRIRQSASASYSPRQNKNNLAEVAPVRRPVAARSTRAATAAAPVKDSWEEF
ncbi:methyl-accepting chemotaxis protein [Rhizobium sp. SG_E_25_P2]|uniref:methyl-accepting chemotaxis protein n=1 Tax=Rhizobium sp. SG_E_25_P2 TaxID=2879942 RepID=UPI00247529BE|nr:methyl-accepting chemotaxis protein [Rhizobium sp. SG_E_25_P2]MDH6268951.1 methyl-accepting chemotaxis protein [Rhizobium sp. SG_E_25_P2]